MCDNDKCIDHEVRLRILEHLAKKFDSRFNWIVGLIMAAVIFPVVLKLLNLV